MNARKCRFLLKLGIAPVCVLAAAVLQTLAFSANSTLAQELKPIADDTLGAESSVVTPTSPQADRIDGGAIRGANVFHSFSQFNIGEGREAYFANPSGIENILSRVTGSDASRIFGKLGVLGNANLFLINPNGIIFGRNASLDVRGSFVGTTANAIQFGNQGFFSATNPNTPALLTVNPSAFFFNQIAAAAIENNSVAPAGTAPGGGNVSGLSVPDGRSLLLLGGNVSLDGGRIRAYGGRVELGGLTSPGTVGLQVNGDNLSLSFPAESTRADVSLTNQASVRVDAGRGGSIAVNARNLDISGGSTLVAGIRQGLGSVGSVAGDITLNATETIRVMQSSILGNIVFDNAIGNSGNLILTTESLFITDGSSLQSVTYGQGNAGNIIINARERVSLNGESSDGIFPSTVASSVESTGRGKGGDIRITTKTLSLTNGGQLIADIKGQGDAGDVIIEAQNRVFLDGKTSMDVPSNIRSGVQQKAIGNGGDIRITTRELLLTNRAVLNASTRGQGDGGNVSIEARERVFLDGTSSDRRFGSDISSRVENNGKGKGGDIRISTGELSLTNNAQLLASTLGQGDAGNIIINARERVSFDGGSSDGISSSAAFSNVEKTAIGKGGNIHITTPKLSITNGAQLVADTRGQGNGGNVIIEAQDRVSFDGERSTAISRVDKGGIGKGGNIHITTRELSLTNSAQLIASTRGQGDGGNVIVEARDRVFLDGTSSNGIFPSAATSSVEPTGRGKGGNIHITTEKLSIINGAQLLASNLGQGDAGNIEILSSSLNLKNQSLISAETLSGQGGNIEIGLKDILLLRQGSQISTNAGTDQQGGDGGNITINAPSGFIIAVPNENSDITANAFTGTGGRVQINASGIYGTQFREKENPQTSDITASSQFGRNGTVELNTPEIDPNSALINLPSVPVDTELAQGCNSPNYAQSSFIITGRGGLPPNPKDILTPDAVQVDWVTLNPEIDKNSRTNISTNPNTTPRAPIVEATGWVFGPNGEVIFTAQAPTQHQSSWQTSPKCHEN